MTLIESIKTYLETCPLLRDLESCIGVDRLDKDPGCYSVETVPCEPIAKRYVDGSSKRQYLFDIVSRDWYGPDVQQNLENLGFYERFAVWLEDQYMRGSLPDLGVGREPRKIEALTCGYVFAEDVDAAQYRIQCKLTYFQEGLLWQE